MDLTTFPNFGAGLSGRFAFEVQESNLLPRVRLASAQRHGISERFKQTQGYSFNGSTEHFLRLSCVSRELIRKDVQRHIEEHQEAWRDSEKRTKFVLPIKKNLILNQGLNAFFTGDTGIGNFTRYCALGVGSTTPAVTDTNLATPISRTGALLTSLGACGTTFNTSSFVCKRTHDDAVRSTDVVYSELGWSHSSAVAANLNIRTLISGGSVTVLTGQQARVVHELTVNCSNTTRQSGTIGVSGWSSTAGEWQWQNLGLSYVNSSGDYTSNSNVLFEPVYGKTLCWCVYSDITLSSWLSNATLNGLLSPNIVSPLMGYCAWTTYTTNSFQRAVVPGTAFAPTSCNSSSIRGFTFGHVYVDGCNNYLTSDNVLVARFTNLQKKLDTHELKLPGFVFSLTRTP